LRIAFDGWYNIDWTAIRNSLKTQAANLKLVFRPIVEAFNPPDEIASFKLAFTETDDPGFGVANRDGRIVDIMEAENVAALKKELETAVEVDLMLRR